jgi:hypothetical protein
LENLPSGAHPSACFSHRARAHAPGFLLQLEHMLSSVSLKPPPLPPYPIRPEATVTPCLFLTALEPPLAKVWSSTEVSHLHGAASIAVEFQSARRPRAGPSSNRAPDHYPDRAHCPRATAEPRSPHRLHHRAEPAEPCRPVVTASSRAFVYTGAAPRRRELAPCCRSSPAIAFLTPLCFSAIRSCHIALEPEPKPGAPPLPS